MEVFFFLDLPYIYREGTPGGHRGQRWREGHFVLTGNPYVKFLIHGRK